MRGADVSSDHYMIMTTLKLKLKKYPAKNAVRKRYNVQTLQNKEVQGKFQISIANRFSALRDIENETDIEKHWQHTKNIWHETCKETLGKKKSDQKEWISAETIQKLNLKKTKKETIDKSRTRASKAQAQKEYTEVDKDVKRSVRKDKKDFIDRLATQAEEAAGCGNLKELYSTTRKLAGKFQQTNKPIKDKDGNRRAAQKMD
ncbi:hypothetical protein ElyMa_000316900 [Elysia marginata]|uniref:Endonuclease/exonuclease/phosphatase domain-containing protein n=1 Tax=Elysia marginata TaxID=1093978 RepID=A0AAV4FAA3_9GAST|nr:hypothetical protein ElyMa_000316900 [Elysia marginata]